MKFIDKIIDNKIETNYSTLISILKDKNKVKYFKHLTIHSQITIIKEMTTTFHLQHPLLFFINISVLQSICELDFPDSKIFLRIPS